VAAITVAALTGAIGGGEMGYRIASGAGGFAFPWSNDRPGSANGWVPQVAGTVLPSVVQLRVTTKTDSSTGSGIIISPDGLMLTNNHVIADADSGAGHITVMYQNGVVGAAHIVGRDPTSDIAVVAAEHATGLTAIAIGDSASARVGQPVLAVGSPLGLGGTVTSGIISALNRAVSVGDGDPSKDPEVLNAIQTDATINPGNSGGPLVDAHGRLIGINSAIASIGGDTDEGGSVKLGFAIPVNQAERIAQQLIRTGHATQAVLGVQVVIGDRLAPLSNPPGAQVAAVTPSSPAAKAGLKVGDIIVKVNDRNVTYGGELVAAIRSMAPGDTVTVQLSDGRSDRVVLAEQPVIATK
jgi:putative serine protease PepD